MRIKPCLVVWTWQFQNHSFQCSKKKSCSVLSGAFQIREWHVPVVPVLPVVPRWPRTRKDRPTPCLLEEFLIHCDTGTSWQDNKEICPQKSARQQQGLTGWPKKTKGEEKHANIQLNETLILGKQDQCDVFGFKGMSSVDSVDSAIAVICVTTATTNFSATSGRCKKTAMGWALS